jgi:hypothetical protein
MRCLVVLLTLALASGNAHAALHMGVAHDDPGTEALENAAGASSPHHHHHHHNDADCSCCCDCLGCTSAVDLTNVPALIPADLPSRVRYEARTEFLSGRAQRPELDPPRTDALI